MKVSNAAQNQPSTATTSAQQTRLQEQKRAQRDQQKAQQAAGAVQQEAPKVKPQQLGNKIDIKA